MSPLELGKPPKLPEKPTWPARERAAAPPSAQPQPGRLSPAPPLPTSSQAQKDYAKSSAQTAAGHPSAPKPRLTITDSPAVTPLPPHDTPARPDTAAVADRLQYVFGNRFQVVGPIAIGGMATVFQLRHRLHDGLFVAKVLHPELAEKPGVIHAFRTEATHAARLGNHPSAVPVFDFGELDGLFFVMMPFIEGEDLDCVFQRLRETGHGFSREETLHMAAQISSLLSFSESEGIVHCDITPGNLRLDNFGRYRLLDFGISQAMSVKKSAAQPAAMSEAAPQTTAEKSASTPPERSPHLFTGGTPLYASPEQIRGEAVDIRADLYALGSVMAECLNGSPVFLADSLEAIRQRHLTGDWKRPESLPASDPLSTLLQRLLAPRREDRLESAYELSGILHAMGYARPEFRASAPERSQPARTTAARRRLS